MGSDLPGFQFGWRGMTVDSFGENNKGPDIWRLVHGQVDWLSDAAGKITVNRDEFKLSEQGSYASLCLRDEVKNRVTEFLSRHAKSRYHLINCHLAYPEEWIVRAGEPQAIYWKLGQRAGIQEVVFPAATNLDLRWCSENAGRLAWHGEPVTVLPQLEIQLTSQSDITSVNPNFEIFAPTPVSLYPHPVFGLAAVFGEWRQLPDYDEPGFFPGLYGVTCGFPPMWERLAAVQFSGPGTRNGFQYLWNPANPVFQVLDPKVWEQIRSSYRSITSETLRMIGDLKGRGMAEPPVWLLRALMENQLLSVELLERCRRRQPSWLPVCIWHEDPSHPRLAVIGTHDKEILSYANTRDEITQYLPNPGAEWELTITEKSAAGI